MALSSKESELSRLGYQNKYSFMFWNILRCKRRRNAYGFNMIILLEKRFFSFRNIVRKDSMWDFIVFKKIQVRWRSKVDVLPIQFLTSAVFLQFTVRRLKTFFLLANVRRSHSFCSQWFSASIWSSHEVLAFVVWMFCKLVFNNCNNINTYIILRCITFHCHFQRGNSFFPGIWRLWPNRDNRWCYVAAHGRSNDR